MLVLLLLSAPKQIEEAGTWRTSSVLAFWPLLGKQDFKWHGGGGGRLASKQGPFCELDHLVSKKSAFWGKHVLWKTCIV